MKSADALLQSGRNPASPHSNYGVLAVLAGLALVIAGIITQLAVIGVAGFLLMVAGASWFLSGLRVRDVPGRLPERRADGGS